MRIAHCQLISDPDNFESNLAKVVAGMERADAISTHIVCFPECYLTGYQDDDARARRLAFSVDSPTMRRVLDALSRFNATVIVGFNETRGSKLYNTALVAHRGKLLGTYSKCFAYMPFHTQGREFPVFERDGVKFGIVICADGGYVEPARILALKGAKIIFSPHYNYIAKESLLSHFQQVRSDHIARAIENHVYFVRGNNVAPGKDEAIQGYEGVGYGDSYILDPLGEIIARSRRHHEDFIFADVDTTLQDRSWGVGRSLYSLRELQKQLLEAAGLNQ